MRVLVAHKFFRVMGGAEVFFFETARLLEEAGHEVAFFSTKHPDNRESEFSEYFVSSHDHIGGSYYGKVRALMSAMYSLSAKRSMSRLIDDFQPDVAHMFGIGSYLSTSVIDACIEAQVPVVMSCNDYKHICPNYKMYHHGHPCEECKGGKYYNAVLNRCCHDSLVFSAAQTAEAYADGFTGRVRDRIDLFLFASSFMAEKTSEFWGEKSFEWRLLRNPFSPSAAHEFGSGDYVLYFGRLSEEKGVEQLLEAAAILPEVPVRIVGDGPLGPLLRAHAEHAALRNVEFLGPLWGSELDRVLLRARVVVVPSVWYENFPYVILQAFAAGKPVVGSSRGGIPEMLGGGQRGFEYPADDYELLAAAIQRAWEDRVLSESMGRAARAYVVDEYDKADFVRKLVEAYAEAIELRACGV
ncbi:MAG: glycosyltransferase [Coriobacteriia bacterium]